MNQGEIINNKHPKYVDLYKLGYLLVGAGILLFVDQKLKTGWLTYAIPAIAGILILGYAWTHKRIGWLTAGAILFGTGAGLITGIFLLASRSFTEQAGAAIVAFSGGWLLVFILASVESHRTQWWSLVVFSVVLVTGIFFWFFSAAGIFVFFIGLTASLGLVLLIWGIAQRLKGLIIAGCIIVTIAPAIYYGWVANEAAPSLVKTGTMLVWLALGWFMISFLGRIVFQKFVWWPIIPGGVFAMVGWGLYIGGSAGKELGFISNTGSIALILFGIYLILLKYSLRK